MNELLKDISLELFLKTNLGSMVQQGMEYVQQMHNSLVALAEEKSGDSYKVLKIGTVLTLEVVKKMAEKQAAGTDPRNFSNKEWAAIAQKVSDTAILAENRQYSVFVFNAYAEYIDASVKLIKMQLRDEDEEPNKIAALCKELKHQERLLLKGKISEPEYTEACLWICLEAMVKLLAVSLRTVIGLDRSRLLQGQAELAVAYARLQMYKEEQAILEAYLNHQHELDEELKARYDAFITDLNERAAQFDMLIENAFGDNFRNLLMNSVALAKAAGVDEKDLLKNEEEIDDFFMN